MFFPEFTTPLLAQEPARPKRVVFFLQNHGFSPTHAMPDGVNVNARSLDRVENLDLTQHRLPRWIDPLEPIKNKVTILQGLNGRHVSPYHGAPFGALGGYRKSRSAPVAETIDCALGRALPSVIPTLVFGWDRLDRMRSSAIYYSSSAWGANMPAPMFLDPTLAFSNLFGVARQGIDRRNFEADTELFDFVRQDADRLDRRLSGAEQSRFQSYRDGLATITEQRRRLLAMADRLQQHVPRVDNRFTQPRHELDWWDASLDVAVNALIAGVTNVVTISSGLCEAGGSWNGLNLVRQGHSLGHTSQVNDNDWLILRRANMQWLVRIVRALEAQREGNGTMMDNTVIVYTSCHAEAQHSTGDRWPFILIGNLGGTLRTGRLIHYPLNPHRQSRSVNSLYLTLLNAVGVNRDQFNLTGPLQSVDRRGPLAEMLV
jgi:hypothetical protein